MLRRPKPLPAPPDCPRGVLTPLQMAGYLRSEQGLPEKLQEHVDSCSACRTNWNFLERTDPILSQERSQRVKLLIRQVTASETPEEAFLREGPAISDTPARARGRRPSQASFALGEARRFLREGISPGEEPTPAARLHEIAARIGALPAGYDRDALALEAGGRFGERIEHATVRGLLSYEKIMSLLDSSDESVPVSEWLIDVIASYPETYCYPDDPLLEQRGTEWVFHLARYRELRKNGTVKARHEADKAPGRLA